MFPTLKIKISGLEDDVEYSVGLEIRSVDCKRYRYVYQRWDVYNGFYSASFINDKICTFGGNSHVLATNIRLNK